MTTPRLRRSFRFGVIGAVVVVAAIAAGLVWFFNRSVPEAVSLEGALQATSSTTTEAPTTGDTGSDDPATTTTTTTTTAAEPPGAAGLDGTWTVDTGIGSFSFEEATGSFAGFRIAEELVGIGATEAVGRTPTVTGSLTIEGAVITSTTIEADVTRVVTNDSRRNRAVQRALDTGTFPTTSFVLTDPIDLRAAPAEGEPVSATAVGEFTLHGITRGVEVPIEAQLTADGIVVVGSFEILFEDYDVSVPSAPIVVSADDRGIVEIQLWFTR